MASNLESDRIRVQHILDAILESLNFINAKTRASSDGDRVLTLALIKQLELIGEAASKVSTAFQEKFPEVPWRAMIATRHRLVHGYFDVDLDIVWTSVNRDLRNLTPLLKTLLKQMKE